MCMKKTKKKKKAKNRKKFYKKILEGLKMSVLSFNFFMIYIIHKMLVLLKII